jgi:histidine triad (HIT) family protein
MMMSGNLISTSEERCIFCKIVAGRAPAKIVYRDELATAFEDIHPISRVHILIVPNRHLASVNEVTADDEPVMGHLFRVARSLAEQLGIQHSGYRLVTNTGPDAGQAVFHVHMHLIGGERLHVPMR